MKKEILLLIPFLTLLPFLCSGQLYTPVSHNAPFFSKENAVLLGAKVNNYGLHYNMAGQLNNKILIVDFQHNNGTIDFNPLNFSDSDKGAELIHSGGEKATYCEIGVGHSLNVNNQKLEFILGLGHEFEWENTRYFVQVDWGNENNWIDAGVSLKSHYVGVGDKNVFLLEPMLQGKLKLWNFRIVNQFGYSFIPNKKEDYMKPTFTVGIEFKFLPMYN